METKIPDQNVPLGTAPQLDDQDPAEPVFTPLVMEERDELKKIFANPAFVKAWRNLRAVEPSAFLSNYVVLAGPIGAQMANNRLHEMRGWKMFSAALLKQAQEPVVKKKVTLEEFPDAGTIEHEALRTSGFVPAAPKVPGQPPAVGLPRPPAKKTRNP